MSESSIRNVDDDVLDDDDEFIEVSKDDVNHIVGIGSKPGYLRAFERRRIVYELRLTGMNFKEIAKIVKNQYPELTTTNYDDWSAENDSNEMVKRLIARSREGLDRYRQDELYKLDRLEEALWDDAKKGDVKAIDAITRLMERRARITGIDAPKRSVNIQINALEEAERFAREQGLTEEESRALKAQVRNVIAANIEQG